MRFGNQPEDYEWHAWFAWHPVSLDLYVPDRGTIHPIIWLETIERRLKIGSLYDSWEYKLKPKDSVPIPVRVEGWMAEGK